MQLAVFATARPHKLECYPCGNKESTLTGIKIRHLQIFKKINLVIVFRGVLLGKESQKLVTVELLLYE